MKKEISAISIKKRIDVVAYADKYCGQLVLMKMILVIIKIQNYNSLNGDCAALFLALYERGKFKNATWTMERTEAGLGWLRV